jgi:superfamily II DNA/RNA helicase
VDNQVNKHINNSGAPKKARWTTAKKIDAKSGPKKAHRGQSQAPRGSDDRAPRTFDRHDDRAPRTYGNDRPARSNDSRDDRPPRSYGNDRPARSSDSRDDRAPRSYGSDRPARSNDSRDERPARTYGSDRPARSNDSRDDRPPRSYGSDRPARAYGSDRPARSNDSRDDRAPRSYGGDRPARSSDSRDSRDSRDDRAPRSYGSDRPARSYGGDRPARSNDSRDDRAPRTYGNDRPSRTSGSDRPARSYGSDRPARTNNSRDDRAPRSYGSDRPVRTYEKREPGAPRSDFKRDANYGKRTDRPARTYEKNIPAPVIDTTPIAIAEDNGFAALGLPAALVERLAREGITAPFPIQTATIPDALAGRDVLGRGQTGSGKTFAFGLPTLTRLAEGDRALARRPRALILTPTRELAMQISDALEPFVHVMGLRHKLVAGGMPYPPQLMALDRGVDLLIATPGRLKDLIERGAVQLTDISIMILDEADHMAEMGFLPEITSILDGLPEGGQRLLFSATLDRGIDAVVKRYLTDAVTHSTDDATASVTTMDHHILLIDPQHKKSITAEVANREGRTLVFVRTKLGADRVAEQLREQGVFAAALHGGLAQGARNRVLNAFKDGSLPVLVATDVAARGIHVDDIGVVLQADPPADHKDYLHRSGRTARAGEKGSVITLALPHQRKGMERLAREAGVDVMATRAVPGDAMLASTGACPPSGVPIPASQSRRLLEAPARPNRRPFGGGHGGRGGQGAGPRRSNDGARGYRGSRD